jgi:hypothetical protein
MREPGVDADQSGARPAQRVEPPVRTASDLLDETLRSPRIRDVSFKVHQAQAAGKSTDYTILEGEPTRRADTDLPIDLPRVKPGLAAA